MGIEECLSCGREKLRILAGFALVFILGFASGYYYLDGKRSTEILTIKDGSADCVALFKSQNFGDTSTEQESTVAADKAVNTGGATAGTVLDSNIVQQPSADTAIKSFASSKNSTLYHNRDCQYVKRIKTENLVWFASQKEAEASGRKPHTCIKQ